MPKKATPTAATEVVTYGQPSAQLAAALKAAGAQVTTAHLVAAIRHVESTRSRFVVEAVALGVLLVAKKLTLRHGEWQPYLAGVWEEVRGATTGEGRRVSHLPEALHNFVRSLRGYCFLGQHFLADLEQQAFPSEARDEPVVLPAITPTEVLALETLPAEKRAAVYQEIERFVAGRSLRRMLSDFRRAESAAEQEEADEAAAAARRRRKGAADAPGQMDFWDELNRPLTELDTLMKSPDFRERTTKEGWLQVADALLAKSKEARAIAASIR